MGGDKYTNEELLDNDWAPRIRAVRSIGAVHERLHRDATLTSPIIEDGNRREPTPFFYPFVKPVPVSHEGLLAECSFLRRSEIVRCDLAELLKNSFWLMTSWSLNQLNDPLRIRSCIGSGQLGK